MGQNIGTVAGYAKVFAVEGEEVSPVDDDTDFTERRHDVGEQQSGPVSNKGVKLTSLFNVEYSLPTFN